MKILMIVLFISVKLIDDVESVLDASSKYPNWNISHSTQSVGDMYWRDYNGTVPKDALFVHKTLLIVQIPINNGLLPGSLYADIRTAFTTVKGKKIAVKDRLQVLCTREPKKFRWESINIESMTGEKLKPLVIGGFEDGSKLYIGKIFHEKTWKIGKVFPPTSPWKGLNLWTDDGCCFIPKDFFVLVYVP